MSLPTPTQHISPGAVSFDQIQIVGPIVDERPIVEDRNHLVSSEPTSCDRAHYAAPALSTPHPTRPGLYFVGDAGHRTEEIGDVLVWSRRWANLPAPYTRPVGTYAYRFPGLAGGSVGSALTITAMSPSTTSDNYVPAPVFTVAGHGLAVGDKVRVALALTGVVSSATAVVTIVAKTTDTFTTTGIFLKLGAGSVSFSSGTATAFVSYREAKTLPADAIEAYSYALPGVTPGVTTSADFRPDPVFEPIITSSGEEVDILGAGTTPTAAEYRAQMAAGAYLVVESGIRPYLGAILERRTVLVRYT